MSRLKNIFNMLNIVKMKGCLSSLTGQTHSASEAPSGTMWLQRWLRHLRVLCGAWGGLAKAETPLGTMWCEMLCEGVSALAGPHIVPKGAPGASEATWYPKVAHSRCESGLPISSSNPSFEKCLFLIWLFNSLKLWPQLGPNWYPKVPRAEAYLKN